MESVNMITSHNRRLAHVRKFVCNPPTRGDTLRMATVEERPTVLGCWSRMECEDNGSTAEVVDGALQEHANTVQDEVQATLVWTDEGGGIVSSKRLRCRYAPQSDDPNEPVMSEALGLNGSQQGTLLQTQRALEGHTRLYLSAHQTQIGMFQGLVRDLFAQQRDLIAMHHKAQMELDAQRAKARRDMEAMYEQIIPSDDPERDSKVALIEQIAEPLGRALPMLLTAAMQQLMASNPQPANGNAPPAAPPKTKAS